MIYKIKTLYNQYPPQFWLIAFGVLVSSTGSSIIWPFQLIYISENLHNPITTIAVLVSVGSLTGLLISFIGGFINDSISPRAIWIGGLLFGLTSALGLLLLNNITKSQATLRA